MPISLSWDVKQQAIFYKEIILFMVLLFIVFVISRSNTFSVKRFFNYYFLSFSALQCILHTNVWLNLCPEIGQVFWRVNTSLVPVVSKPQLKSHTGIWSLLLTVLYPLQAFQSEPYLPYQATISMLILHSIWSVYISKYFMLPKVAMCHSMESIQPTKTVYSPENIRTLMSHAIAVCSSLVGVWLCNVMLKWNNCITVRTHLNVRINYIGGYKKALSNYQPILNKSIE